MGWKEIQYAIWILIDDRDYHGSISGVNACVGTEIANEAAQHTDYVPGCGDKLGVLFAIDNSLDHIHRQVIVAVMENPPCFECPTEAPRVDPCVDTIDHDSLYEDEWEVRIEIGSGNYNNLGDLDSLWRVELNPGSDIFVEAWCVDIDRFLGSGTYKADRYSTYSEIIPNMQTDSNFDAVDRDTFLPAVNYILNTDRFRQGQNLRCV